MKHILMVTKPLVPPWDDSAKNLARDVVSNVDSVRFHILTEGRYSFEMPHVREEALYGPAGGYRLPLFNQAKVFFRLLKPDAMDCFHFFFAPNPKSSIMARWALKMRGFTRSIQTVCSAPATFEGVEKLLFADITVTVSEDTKTRLEAEGVPDVRCIHPAVPITDLPEKASISAIRKSLGLPEDRLLALFAGDLDFSNAAETLFQALPEILRNPALHVVFCNRLKTERARGIREELENRIRDRGFSERVTFLSAQKDLNPLLQAVDLLLLHPDTLYAKMDLPLVLLEAMGYGKAVVISDLPSMQEAFRGQEAGLIVPPGDSAALAEAVGVLAENEQRRERLALTGREVVREFFNPMRLGEKYARLYEEWLSK